jgi:hypothetical protein
VAIVADAEMEARREFVGVLDTPSTRAGLFHEHGGQALYRHGDPSKG